MSSIELSPELLRASAAVAREIHSGDLDVVDRRYYPSERHVRNIAQKFDAELVGMGGDCFVLASHNPREDDRILSVYYNSIREVTAKSLYHRQNILTTLLPHNFPRFYAALEIPADPEDKMGTMWAIVRQRIRGETRNKFLWENELNFSHRDKNSTYPFANAWETMMDLELPFIRPDPGPGNFILGEDGGVYYVDVSHLRPDAGDIEWNTTAIVTYMEENNTSDREIRSVLRSIDRLTTDLSGHLFWDNHPSEEEFIPE